MNSDQRHESMPNNEGSGYDVDHEQSKQEGSAAEEHSVPGRRGISPGHFGHGDIQRDAGHDADRPEGGHSAPLPGSGAVIDATVFAQLTSQLEQHLHVPLQMPDQDRLERMKRETPEAYKVWLRVVDRQSRTDAHLREMPYTTPYKVARLGQFCGLIAVISLLVLAGYMTYKGQSGWAFGTGLTGVIGLAAVFNGNQARK